jgi:molecular chaperone GrpE
MTDDEDLHDEAEALRKETAEDAPELQEHDRIAELENQLEEANAKTLYAAAEIQNVRRRLEQEKQQASAYAAAQFAKDMLAIKDHLERALVAVNDELRGDKVASQFLAGIEATAREIESAFARNGISRIASVGEKLDPHRHQAMMEIPTTEAAPGTIVEEMQAGYMLKDRLLRPALVGVAKKPD